MPSETDYRLLVLSSDPTSVESVATLARSRFPSATVIFWEFGNTASKAQVLEQIEHTDYNLLISYINGIILKPHHLERARYGAVNIHPAPPEHGGCWGIWAQPVIRRDERAHHGVTVHEIDADIDHGPIYTVERWPVTPTASIQSVADDSFAACMRQFEGLLDRLAASPNGSRDFTVLDEKWDGRNRHTPLATIRRWFGELPPAHPAHAERVWLNHPRAIIRPPYFDDL